MSTIELCRKTILAQEFIDKFLKSRLSFKNFLGFYKFKTFVLSELDEEADMCKNAIAYNAESALKINKILKLLPGIKNMKSLGHIGPGDTLVEAIGVWDAFRAQLESMYVWEHTCQKPEVLPECFSSQSYFYPPHVNQNMDLLISKRVCLALVDQFDFATKTGTPAVAIPCHCSLEKDNKVLKSDKTIKHVNVYSKMQGLIGSIFTNLALTDERFELNDKFPINLKKDISQGLSL
ncbi:MAG: hypothetical protein FWC00_00345 [Firmicutes bacterium]|nr:hypothetical protein [Bacillota bacterium]